MHWNQFFHYLINYIDIFSFYFISTIISNPLTSTILDEQSTGQENENESFVELDTAQLKLIQKLQMYLGWVGWANFNLFYIFGAFLDCLCPVPFKSFLSCVVYLKFVWMRSFFPVFFKSIKMSKIHALSQEILRLNITPVGSTKKNYTLLSLFIFACDLKFCRAPPHERGKL